MAGPCCRDLPAGLDPVGLNYDARMAGRLSLTAQPAWPQLQEISVVSPASSQYVLQYLSPLSTVQLQAGWAHFFVLSGINTLPF